jgi:hypothetical protein
MRLLRCGTVVLLSACVTASLEAQAGGGPYELTPARLAAFQKGLEIEIGIREGIQRRFAGLKTQAEWDQCAAEAGSSQEAQKLDEEWAARAEKVKPEEIMEFLTKQAEAKQALYVKHCGMSPRDVERLQSDEYEGARKAGVAEFAKSLATVTAHDRGAYERIMALLQETVCPLPANQRAKALREGIELPGAEGNQLLPARDVQLLDGVCAATMPVLKRISSSK